MHLLQRKDTVFEGDKGPTLDLDVKALTAEGQFEGYASVYGTVDQGNDIVEAGAFDESLRVRGANKVKMLLHHDTRMLVGNWLDMSSDGKGLFVKGQLALGIERGKEAYELLKSGALDGMSIGYRTLERTFDATKEEIRRIIKAELWEVSLVTFPMNEGALVSSVKSFETSIDGLETLSDAERFLREAGREFSRKEAVDFVSKVKKIAQREAGDDPTDAAEADIIKLAAMMRGH